MLLKKFWNGYVQRPPGYWAHTYSWSVEELDMHLLHTLQGLLPNEHLDCWWLFVQVCLIFSQLTITNSDISRGDCFLIEFCQKFEQIYGKNYCTPNMHLHCHIAECCKDYGPAHTTWCFSFERCNGILGAKPNNNKSLAIEKTMIKRFIQQMEYPSTDLLALAMFSIHSSQKH